MHNLPELPYDYNSLEPYIDEETMRIHHTKHHQAYVDNLNKALEKVSDELRGLQVNELLRNIDKVPSEVRQTVINNGGGHANHSFFWKIMIPGKKASGPEGLLAKEIDKNFGGFDKFKELFTEKALTIFGSGWAFLMVTSDKKIMLKRHSFQNSPLMQGNVPILGIDVWEHAYYLKYQNKRADYIKAWFEIVNWKEVNENFEKALEL